MSDYDDDDVPLGRSRGEEEDGRTRRGSEGFEVRPAQPWLRMDEVESGEAMEMNLYRREDASGVAGRADGYGNG